MKINKNLSPFIFSVFLSFLLTGCLSSMDDEAPVVRYDSYGTDLSGFRSKSKPVAKLQEIENGIAVESSVTYEEVDSEIAPEIAPAQTNESLPELPSLTIHFDLNSSKIHSKYVENIALYVNALNQNPNRQLVLSGHADERGSREFNMGLSEDRAISVLNFIIQNGLHSPEQVITIGYGEEKPNTLGNTEAIWSRNRRVDFEFTRIQ